MKVDQSSLFTFHPNLIWPPFKNTRCLIALSDSNKGAYLGSWNKIPRIQNNAEKAIKWAWGLVKNSDSIFSLLYKEWINTQPLCLSLRIIKEKRQKDFKSQRNREISMRFCFLDMSAPLHIKYHQHGCLYMTITRVTTIDILTWEKESLQGLKTRQKSTRN